jgi:hypothetical protein
MMMKISGGSSKQVNLFLFYCDKKLAPTTHAERLIKFQMLATSTTNGSL